MSSAKISKVKYFQRKKLRQLSLLSIFAVLLTGCFTDKPKAQLEQSVQGFYDADLNHNGQYSLVASIHHGASLWRIEDQERLYNWNHTNSGFTQVDLVALADTGKRGFTVADRDLIAWNSKTGKSIGYWQFPDRITCINADKDGIHIVVGMRSGQAMMVDTVQNGFIWRTRLQNSITACDLNSDANALALGTASGALKTYNVNISKQTETNREKNSTTTAKVTPLFDHSHPYSLHFVRLLNNNELILSASQHHELQIHDIRAKTELLVLPLKSISISHAVQNKLNQKNILVLADTSLRVRFFDMNNWKNFKTLVIPKRSQWKPSGAHIEAISFYENQLIATGSDGITSIYNDLIRVQ